MNERQITVTYTLREEQAERLEKITKAWDATKGADTSPSTPEKLFTFMMTLGSFYTINEKLDFFEEYTAKMAEQKVCP